jgi:hypothetical protein
MVDACNASMTGGGYGAVKGVSVLIDRSAGVELVSCVGSRFVLAGDGLGSVVL